MLGAFRCIFADHEPSEEEIERMEKSGGYLETQCIHCKRIIVIEQDPEDADGYLLSSWM